MGSHRLAVRTPASHAGNGGSIPPGITIKYNSGLGFSSEPCFIDGLVKSPIAALRISPRHCSVPSVRFIPWDSQALISNFLRTRLYYLKKVEFQPYLQPVMRADTYRKVRPK